jgi:hypothetical protein
MKGDAMDAFVRLRGEEALAKLMHAALGGVKIQKPAPKCRATPPSRKGKVTDKVKGHIVCVEGKFANDIFSITDVQREISGSRGKAQHLVEVMQKLEIIHRVPSIGGEQGHRFKLA